MHSFRTELNVYFHYLKLTTMYLLHISEEKKLTVNELANRQGILQEANGWKVFHLSAQMEEIVS